MSVSYYHDKIETVYAAAKTGRWREVLDQVHADSLFARYFVRYIRPSSGFTALHHAVNSDNMEAVQEMIKHGASISLKSLDGKKLEFNFMVAFLERALTHGSEYWAPSTEASFVASSCAWHEAKESTATEDMLVMYSGELLHVHGCDLPLIRRGDRYYMDDCGRVLIGWHGSHDPPRRYDGESLLEHQFHPEDRRKIGPHHEYNEPSHK